MHLTTPTGNFWIAGTPEKKVLKKLTYTHRSKKLQTALTVTRYFSTPMLFLVCFAAAGFILKEYGGGNLAEFSLEKLIGVSALIVVPSVYLWSLYGQWVTKDERMKDYQDKARREGFFGAYHESLYAYRALGIDTLPTNLFEQNKRIVDRFLNQHGNFRLPMAYTFSAEAVLALYRERMQILDDAATVLQSIGGDINHLMGLREETREWLTSARESFERQKLDAQAAIDQIETEMTHQ